MAVGDLIYVYCNVALTGYGAAGDVVQITESVASESLVTQGLLTVVAGPSATPFQSQTVGELAYASNITGTVTLIPANGTATAIPGCTVVVPPSARPVWITAEVCFQITAAAAGMLAVAIYETTGAPSLLYPSMIPVTNLAGAQSKFAVVRVVRRLGPTVTTRNFSLYAQTVGDAGTLAASVLNTAANISAILAEAK